MDDEKIKHLELVQNVILRLAQNSFALKGWAVTIVAAIFVLSAKDSNKYYLIIGLIPTIIFWGLDAYYLRQERLFRKLYDSVRQIDPVELKNNPFSMDTLPFTFPEFSQTMAEEKAKVSSWWRTCWTKTLAWLYGAIAFTIMVVTFIPIIQDLLRR